MCLWVFATIGMRLYARYAATYEQIYGALGGVVVLLVWLWLIHASTLLGAAINVELWNSSESETPPDSTGEEPPKPENGDSPTLGARVG